MRKMMMLIACALIGSVSMNVHAQSDVEDLKHEFAISYGSVSNSTWLATMEDIAMITSSLGTISYSDGTFFGPLSAEYFYHISPKIGVGVIGAFARETKDIFVGGKKYNDDKATNTYITLLPAVKFNWVDKQNWGLYSKLGLGATFRNQKQEWSDSNSHQKSESSTDVFLNFQATAIGIEGGLPNLRLFAELGVGEQGIVLGGVRARF